MGTAAHLDWLYHVLGWMLAAAGVLLLFWALFRDRSRGRRRCPKCWYDLAGVPGLKCPECGVEAAAEHRLHRTRRRWRLVLPAIALAIAGHIVSEVPGIRKRTWWAIAPRPLLALLVPAVSDQVGAPRGVGPAQGWLEAEVRHRLFARPWMLRPLWPGERVLVRVGARLALRREGSTRRELLAAQLLALTTLPSSTPEPPVLILARSGAAYATCTTYRDTGMVKGSIGKRDERPFVTAFVRGGGFRFEFLSQHPHETKFSSRYVVWGSEGSYKNWWTIGGTSTHKDLSMAVAGPTGISGGSASTIPMQLVGTSWFTMVKQPSLHGAEVFDGHPCNIIRGVDFIGMTEDIWIDARTFAIRKIHLHWDHPSITVYRPEFDAGIPAEFFEFNPDAPEGTPLGDGEAQSATFRPLAGNPRDGAIPVPESKRRVR